MWKTVNVALTKTKVKERKMNKCVTCDNEIPDNAYNYGTCRYLQQRCIKCGEPVIYCSVYCDSCLRK
jgi:hypothetical protein